MESRFESPFEVIDALIDGERVDAAALRAALAAEAGRDYLVDAWLLREAAQSDASADTPRVGSARPMPLRAVPSPRSRPWFVAAAFASAIIGGFAVGYGTADRVEPGPAGTPRPTVSATATPAGAFPVPAATRVIQLEFHTPSGASGGD